LFVDEFNIVNPPNKLGRPRKVDIGKIYEMIFYIARTGIQFSDASDIFNIAKSTFSKYLKIITESNILEKVYNKFITEISFNNLFITDTFTVKSMDGKDGLGRNPTDRGRKGLKVHLITDINGISKDISIQPANIHDSKILKNQLNTLSFQNRVECLADSGYVGKELNRKALEKNIKLIVKPKKKRNKLPTHILLKLDSNKLKKYRNRIELLNGQIRRHRGIMIKYVRKITSYKTLLFSVIISISCFNYFIKPHI
jgi:hypothetical protein